MTDIKPDDFIWFTPPKKEFKTERINVRMTPYTKEMLQRLAAAEGRSASNYIEHLICKAIENEQAKKEG